MKRTPAWAIALFMIVISLVVLVVAWDGVSRGNRLNALEAANRQMRIELDQAKRDLLAARKATQEANTRAVTAEDRANRLQARVDALEATLRRQGVDPGTVVVVTTAAGTPSPTATASTRPTASARPSTKPSPRPSPTPTCTPLPILGCRR